MIWKVVFLLKTNICSTKDDKKVGIVTYIPWNSRLYRKSFATLLSDYAGFVNHLSRNQLQQ